MTTNGAVVRDNNISVVAMVNSVDGVRGARGNSVRRCQSEDASAHAKKSSATSAVEEEVGRLLQERLAEEEVTRGKEREAEEKEKDKEGRRRSRPWSQDKEGLI